MTGRALLRPLARADLETIWDYTEARWGTAQAILYLRDLWRHIEAATAQPQVGRDCSDVRAGYRKLLSGSHVVCYRPIDGGIEVVRVLHGRMNFGQHVE